MARTSWNPEVGPLPANKPGNHGGIDITAGPMSTAGVNAEGSNGNPGLENPWEGADATAIGADTKLPPLKSL